MPKDIAVAETFDTEVVPDEETSSGKASEFDIFAFLPENTAKTLEETVVIDAPPGYVNRDGSRAKMKLRKPSMAEITEITERYRKSTILKNNKGRCLTTDRGNVAVNRDTDSTAFNNALIAACLVEPNPGSQELMKAYATMDPTKVVPLMFPSQEAYLYILEHVTDLISGANPEEDELVEAAKN